MSIEEKIKSIRWQLAGCSGYRLVKQHKGTVPLAVIPQREFSKTISAILDLIEEIHLSTQTARENETE